MGSDRPTDVDLALMMGYRWVTTGEFWGGDHPWGRSKWLISPKAFAERLSDGRVVWEPVVDPGDEIPLRRPDGALPSPNTRWLFSPGLFYGPGGPCEWAERQGWNIDRTTFLDIGLPMHARTHRTFVDYHLSDFDETHQCQWAHGEAGTMMEADAEAFLIAFRAIAEDRERHRDG